MRVSKKTQKNRPTMSELRVLVRLPNTILELADRLNVTRQRITQLAHSLKSKGWITRMQRGRFVRLEITEEGQKALAEFKAHL